MMAEMMIVEVVASNEPSVVVDDSWQVGHLVVVVHWIAT
jgi:hypothetical protein